MNYHKFMILSMLLLLSFGAVTAQDESQNKSEFSVYGKGIFNTLNYNLQGDAERDNGYGAGVGLEYSMNLNNRWSISAGIEYQQYRSETNIIDLNDQYQTVDVEGSVFDFHYSANTYSEKQWIDVINIPVLLRYEMPARPLTSASIYGAVGFQIGIPVNNEFETSTKELETSGYFPKWDLLLNGPEFMGFGNWDFLKSGKQELDIRKSYSFLFELGLKQLLSENRNLYLGFYADLGVNELIKDSGSPSPLLEYKADAPTDFQFNSIFNSAPQLQGATYASKAKLRGFGIKIRYAFEL